MGKLNQFMIMLAENKAVYLPGEVVSGHVLIDLKSSMEMSAIRLKFAGKAFVRWTETRSTGKTTYTVTYTGKEDFFEQVVFLRGQDSGDRGELHAGQHTYPFTFTLPSPLSSSFESRIGHIRYYLKCTIVKPWKFDHNTKVVFTVLDNLDLNSLPNALSPSGCSDSKNLCCLCCRSGPIEVECHLDRTGYVPGEWVVINATLHNGSSSKIVKTSVELVQEVAYHATSKTRTERKNVVQIFGEGCGAHKSVEWTNTRLQIPPVPPSESPNCRVIDITYYIQIQAHLRTCAINLRGKAPIIIGTIPLRSLGIYSSSNQSGSAPPEYPSVDEASAPTKYSTPAPEYPGAHVGPASTAPTQYGITPPPPTYAAVTGEAYSIKDEDDNDYTMGETTYAPQYTFYNWNESAFTYN